jgi:hypothetical protein
MSYSIYHWAPYLKNNLSTIWFQPIHIYLFLVTKILNGVTKRMTKILTKF